jgi:hypothetical protein
MPKTVFPYFMRLFGEMARQILPLAGDFAGLSLPPAGPAAAS